MPAADNLQSPARTMSSSRQSSPSVSSSTAATAASTANYEMCQPLLQSSSPSPQQRRAQERFSAVAMEMLREQEDRDLHPFGRGGRFEGVLYSRRVKVQVDHTKFLAWIVFASFILLTSAAIIFLAEMERRQKSQQQSLLSTTSSTIDGLLNSSNNTTS